jgi:hypothetical protein
VEFKTVTLVGRLAVIDEVGVDVHANTRGVGTLEMSDDFAGAAADLDDDIVGMLLAGFHETTTGIDVEFIKDRVFVHYGVLP